MKEAVLHVDLSPGGPDFQPLALDLGLPMIDAGGANYRVLRRWLGDVVAEPIVTGSTVAFCVQRDGRRQLGVECVPIGPGDLERGLRAPYEALRERLKGIRPETPTEQLLLPKLALPERHRDCVLFKHRTAGGPWQLLWCWGYQRRDEEPGKAVVCDRPDCARLYVRRRSGPARCPACQGAGTERRRPRWGRRAVAAVVLLAGFAALGYWGTFGRGPAVPQQSAPVVVTPRPEPAPAPGLVVTPEAWSGPAGGRVAFRLQQTAPDGTQRDVGPLAVASVDDSRVARVDGLTSDVIALAPGKTAVHFRIGSQHATATLAVEPPRAPKRLAIEPEAPSLNVGATAQLRLVGEYDDGSKADLTDAAYWKVAPKERLFGYRGLIEGLAAGDGEITAEYRATPDAEPLRASQKVTVADEPYKALALSLASDELVVGQAVAIRADAVTETRKTVPVSGSSSLRLEVEPAGLAEVRDDHLVGLGLGAGRLVARFRGLDAAHEFRVTSGPEPVSTPAPPGQLAMVVGEIADLPGTAPASKLESGDTAIVAISDDGRLVAKSAGTTTVIARSDDVPSAAPVVEKPSDSAAEKSEKPAPGEVAVTVAPADFASAAIVPQRIVVPADETVRFRVMGQIRDDRQAEIAPELLNWEILPPAEAAGFEASRLELRGLDPASEVIHPLVGRFRDFKLAAEVEVVPGPFTLSLTPAGPVDLPVGQTEMLHVWADLRANRRVEIPSDRVDWQFEPVEGFALSAGTVTAKSASAKPWEVRARYRDGVSNPVQFRGAPAAAVDAAIDTGRPVLFPGDSGRLRADARGPGGDAPLDPESARFESTKPDILTVDPKSGTYQVRAPGDANVKVDHPGLPTGATSKLHVADPARTRLVLEPDRLKLAVDQVGRLSLSLLEDVPGGEPIKTPITDLADVRLTVERPEAVKLNGLDVVALAPAGPFEVASAYGGMSARTSVEVADANKQGLTLRFEPATVKARPGASVTPRLEARGSEGDEWREVRSDAVTWKETPSLVVRPGTATSPAALTLAKGTRGVIEAVAQYRGQEAKLRIEVEERTQGKDQSAGALALVREPAGESVPEGASQRYSVVVKDRNASRAAAGVKWPADFENDHIAWKAPVLTAKQRGHTQEMTVQAEGRSLRFRATTVAPRTRPQASPAPRKDAPKSVRIAPKGKRKGPVQVTPGGRSDDYQVHATYADGTTRDVTSRANVTRRGRAKDQRAVYTTVDNRLYGVRPGKGVVDAEYRGVKAQEGLDVEVVDHPKIDAIRLEPAHLRLAAGESQRLRAVGLQGDRSVGEITGWADLVWKTRSPEIVAAHGPTVTALKPGSGGVTVQLATIVSNPIEIDVGPRASGVARNLDVDPDMLTIQVGESARLGRDVRLSRGDADFSDRCEVLVIHPDVIDFDPAQRTLTGRAPGTARVAMLHGDGRATLTVHVRPAPAAGAEEVALRIEPDEIALSVGTFQDLRVVALTAGGERIDRTFAARLESSAPAVVSLRGPRARAQAPGEATVTARLPGTKLVATSSVVVADADRPDLLVEPAALALYVGEQRRLTVRGRDTGGTRALYEHPDLSFAVAGADPSVVSIGSGGVVGGRRPGVAEVVVRWKGAAEARVPVHVTDAEAAALAIVPADATVARGDHVAFRVVQRMGDRDIDAEGARLEIEDPSIARVDGASVVRGLSEGRTRVTARKGNLRAIAHLTVEGPRPAAAASTAPVEVRIEPDTLRLAEGSTSPPLTVFAASPDGRQVDITASAKLTTEPGSGTIVLDPTAAGPVVRAVKSGTALVHAAASGAHERTPLAVTVVAVPAGQARLEAAPSTLRLRVGESRALERVALIAGPGVEPVPVPYSLAAEGADVVTIDAGHRVRAVRPGTTSVVVTAKGPAPAAGDLRTTVAVTIAPAEPSAGAQLRLTGPSRTTVGATVALDIELVGHEGSTIPLLPGSARLIVSQGEALVTIQPGASLVARAPGTAVLQAQYRDLISNSLRLQIQPPARTFRGLELEIARGPLAVGESRTYRVWGDPADGGPPQDITALVSSEAQGSGRPRVTLETIAPKSGADVAAHAPPRVVGRAPGTIRLKAECDGVMADSVALEVRAIDAADLAIDPAASVVRLGEASPRLVAALVTSEGLAERTVDATWESLDPAIAAPGAEPGRFVGRSPGKARIKATVGGRTATAEVTVIGNPIAAVRSTGIREDANRFEIGLEVSTPGESSALEYRVVADSGEATSWVSGQGPTVSLQSPRLALRPHGSYRLVIEARERGAGMVERYPYQFRLGLNVIETPAGGR